MKEFAFLTNEISSTDNGDSNITIEESSSTDWNVDKKKLIELTEQYKKDRKSAKNSKQIQQQQQQLQQNLISHTAITSQRPNKSALQAMIANLNENNNESQTQQQQFTNSNDSNSSMKYSDSPTLNNLNFSNSPKMFLEEDGFANDSALGELSRLSVSNASSNNSLNLSSLNDETIIDVSCFTFSFTFDHFIQFNSFFFQKMLK